MLGVSTKSGTIFKRGNMNIELVVKLIRVERPVKFIIRKKFSNKFVAQHQAFTLDDVVCQHIITINMGNVILGSGDGERDLETLIVHELIHAWQSERGYNDKHGKTFQRKVKQVAGKLGMPRLYIKTVDT